MISSFRLPRGLTHEELHDELKRLGYVIYAGQGELSRSMFRVANMGALVEADLDALLPGLAAARARGADDVGLRGLAGVQ
ncbi:hypothetical protein BH18CHL2_BH18CHL2_00250 [soil metagenome]